MSSVYILICQIFMLCPCFFCVCVCPCCAIFTLKMFNVDPCPPPQHHHLMPRLNVEAQWYSTLMLWILVASTRNYKRSNGRNSLLARMDRFFPLICFMCVCRFHGVTMLLIWQEFSQNWRLPKKVRKRVGDMFAGRCVMITIFSNIVVPFLENSTCFVKISVVTLWCFDSTISTICFNILFDCVWEREIKKKMRDR